MDYKKNTYYKDKENEVYFEPNFKTIKSLKLIEISKTEVDEILKEKEKEPPFEELQ